MIARMAGKSMVGARLVLTKPPGLAPTLTQPQTDAMIGPPAAARQPPGKTGSLTGSLTGS